MSPWRLVPLAFDASVQIRSHYVSLVGSPFHRQEAGANALGQPEGEESSGGEDDRQSDENRALENSKGSFLVNKIVKIIQNYLGSPGFVQNHLAGERGKAQDEDDVGGQKRKKPFN